MIFRGGARDFRACSSSTGEALSPPYCAYPLAHSREAERGPSFSVVRSSSAAARVTPARSLLALSLSVSWRFEGSHHHHQHTSIPRLLDTIRLRDHLGERHVVDRSTARLLRHCTPRQPRPPTTRARLATELLHRAKNNCSITAPATTHHHLHLHHEYARPIFVCSAS